MSDQSPRFTLEVEKNMAMELIYAAYSTATLESLSITPPYDSCGKYTQAWLQNIDETISPFERHDLQLVFSTAATGVFLFYLVISGNLTDTEGLIRVLHELSEEDFIKGFRNVIRVDDTVEDWINTAEVIKAFEKDWMELRLDFDKEAAALVALLKTPSYFKVRLEEVLGWFSERYILPFSEGIGQRVDDHIAAYRQVMAEDPGYVVDRLTNGNAEVVAQQNHRIILYPVALNTRDISIFMPGLVYMVYGVDHARKLLDSSIEERTDELVKAISDPKRMQILRLLKGRAWYSREIAGELGLTPATVSYHIDLLFQAGLIKFDKPEGRRFYYNLNEKGMAELIDCLKEEFVDR